MRPSLDGTSACSLISCVRIDISATRLSGFTRCRPSASCSPVSLPNSVVTPTCPVPMVRKPHDAVATMKTSRSTRPTRRPARGETSIVVAMSKSPFGDERATRGVAHGPAGRVSGRSLAGARMGSDPGMQSVAESAADEFQQRQRPRRGRGDSRRDPRGQHRHRPRLRLRRLDDRRRTAASRCVRVRSGGLSRGHRHGGELPGAHRLLSALRRRRLPRRGPHHDRRVRRAGTLLGRRQADGRCRRRVQAPRRPR